MFEAMARLIETQRIRTIAYHPQANGMIEQWHRSLKAAIMSHDTKVWTQVLPMVLLGLRNSYKDDIKTSAAKMIYGATLRVPGEYFANEEPIGCPEMFVQKLREQMRQMRETPTVHHIKQRIFRHKELEDYTHVFVRVDRGGHWSSRTKDPFR